MTELAIVGADIHEVLGSATAIHLLTGIPLWAGAIITICDSFVFLFIHYFGVRKLESFFATLILIVGICFITNMVTSNPDIKEIMIGWLVPGVPPGSVPAMLGLIGTVIMPHNLHLHSALVITRKVNIKNRTHVNEAIIYNIMDSSISIITFFINASVICTFAAYVIREGHAGDPNYNLDLETASAALEKTFGTGARYIWAVGLLASG